ncbi:GH17851, partial [Drosophila grimshawi]
VLIAASVCTKNGKVILSRQYVEMTKARIEGLLAAFPKLMTAGKQHTYVETDSVRYVYQPMEKLYMLLITTKASNILEDLETLRLFSKVIPEYCHSLDEKEIVENAFNLIFAFDEIVALGYRESVNLAQIKTFVEMDSHEEKVYQAVRLTQEREARQKMREKAKELQRQRMEANKRGGPSMGSLSDRSGGFSTDSGFGSSSGSSIGSGGNSSFVQSEAKIVTVKAAQKPVSRNALKLGGKSKDVDSFVDQLKSEGEKISTLVPAAAPGSSGAAANASAAAKAKISADIHTESVHLKMEDKLVVRLGRDGGVQQFELTGLLTLRITDENLGRIKVKLANNDAQGIQLQTHPNVDKELFKSRAMIGLKNPAKPFPLNTDVGVLKWRFITQDESAIPLTINCWPSDNGEGGCDVNIEYELETQHLELQDVVIVIPLPLNVQPSVAEFDGTYKYDARKHVLQWQIPVIDAANKSGSMEFSCSASIPGDFFPLQVSFVSKTPYAAISALDVVHVDNDESVKYSSETMLFVEKYEIV